MTAEDASSVSTLPGPADADTLSKIDLERLPSSVDDFLVPVAEGDLRETFNLPLISAREAEQAGMAADPAISDAAALFDDRAGPRRRMSTADARARPRRCSHCGGLVPQGMSICVTCGVDQETGLRVGLEDDLAPPPPPPPQGPPIHITVIGGLCSIAGSILLIFALIQSVRGAGQWENYGWLCLALVSAFGIYASVQFIRGKSAKPLMLALFLGVIIDLSAMVAWPLIRPNLEDQEQIVRQVFSKEAESTGIEIRPNVERLDHQRIALGIVLVGVYAMLSFYLISPLVKKYFHTRVDRGPW